MLSFAGRDLPILLLNLLIKVGAVISNFMNDCCEFIERLKDMFSSELCIILRNVGLIAFGYIFLIMFKNIYLII